MRKETPTMTDLQNPLMSGTRLFLNTLLIVLYACAAIMALAAVVITIAMFVPSRDIGFTVADNVMMLSLLAYLLVAIYFFRVLRAIVVSVDEGDPFNLEYPDRLTRLAWLSTIMWAIDLAYIFWQVPLQSGDPQEAALGALAADAINHLVTLIGPITLFILARVFRHGAAMREDLEGTV